MHFQLPSNLQQELLAYDPRLKALAKETKAKTTKKPKFPLGKIPCLIPTHIVREQLQHDAIEQINASLAPERYHRFTKVVDIATPQARTITTAILYHFEQCWYAAWLPGKDDDYIYGYSYAFKDTTAAAITCAVEWRRVSKSYLGLSFIINLLKSRFFGRPPMYRGTPSE